MSDQDCLHRLCRICHEPVSLNKSDTVLDEDGKPVHEHCYVKGNGYVREIAMILLTRRLEESDD